MVCVVNFAPVLREQYRIGVEQDAYYIEALNSDDEKYGGSGVKNEGWIGAEDIPMHGYDHSIEIKVPPLSAVYFTTRPKHRKKALKSSEE